MSGRSPKDHEEAFKRYLQAKVSPAADEGGGYGLRSSGSRMCGGKNRNYQSMRSGESITQRRVNYLSKRSDKDNMDKRGMGDHVHSFLHASVISLDPQNPSATYGKGFFMQRDGRHVICAKVANNGFTRAESNFYLPISEMTRLIGRMSKRLGDLMWWPVEKEGRLEESLDDLSESDLAGANAYDVLMISTYPPSSGKVVLQVSNLI